jgi:hypothetical protein
MGEIKIGLKNVREFHGHDGQGFDASLYVNGKRTAIVSDDGWGGEWMFDVIDKKRFALLEQAIKPLTWTSEYDNSENPMTLDIFLNPLVDEAFEKKRARGKLLTKKDGEFYRWNIKFNGDVPELQGALDNLSNGQGHTVVNHLLAVRVLETA